IGEIIGAIVAALTIGGVLLLLDSAWGFGSEQILAPQATLMKMIVEGVMDGNLPWALIFIGAFIAIAFEVVGISALPVAIGLYLPLELSSTIMIGGLIRLVVDKVKKGDEKESNDGVLFCSGLIAGEGLVGILLAILAVAGISDKINISGVFTTGSIGTIVVLAIIVLLIFKFALGKKAVADEK
ncbi:MAG: OPT/YSL family transporter, partial [Lachnospiraceae bacterium]|nr:OPT/YSL family transporter [Lachnospiraceae bacterium]